MAGIAAPISPPIVVTSTTTGAKHSTSLVETTQTQDLIIHELTDDGAGGLGDWGTVSYATKTVVPRLVSKTSTSTAYNSDYENAETFETTAITGGGGSEARKGGNYTNTALGEEVLASSTVFVDYTTGFTGATAHTMSIPSERVSISLCQGTSDYVVPNSVRFTWMGHVYEDYDGIIWRDRTDVSIGIESGFMNYTDGVAVLTDWEVSGPASALTVQSLWTTRKNWTTASIFMRTQAAPIKPTAFVMNLADTKGNSIVATADGGGFITGTHLRGRIDYETGVVELQFGDYVLDSALTAEQKAEWWYNSADVGAVIADQIWRPWPVDPTTLRYNSVSYFYLPLDADLLGIDPVRLPQDGRVVMFRPGGFAVVGNTQTMSPATVSNGQTLNTARTRLSRIRVIGSDGNTINNGYTTNLDAGTVTFTDVTGYSQPVTVEHRIEDMALVRDVQVDGTLSFTRPLTHDYPVGSVVSSAIVANGRDLYARVSSLFDQASWDGTTFSDTLVDSPATGTYNDVLAPVLVTNRGAVTERWVLRFTSTTAFQVIGEHVGVVGTGTINANYAPINPATGTPYFTIYEAGWGTGWSVGNIVRINTIGAQMPVWVVRTIQQGPEAGTNYSFSLLTRGDVDRP